MTSSKLIDDLRAGGYELVETHISWVLLGERDVFKLKKPVDLDFLDFTTFEARQRACLAEVELNRRLAPDVYLGLALVRRDDSGRHRFGGEGELVDVAVHMRRLPEEHRADLRLSAGGLSEATLGALAELLARFHDACPNDDQVTRNGAVEAIRHNVRENFYQAAGRIEQVLQDAQVDALERWQLDFLDRHQARFRDRQRNGRIRDGHGDLRLEHIYVDDQGGIRVIDAIEFSERFRHADVCADIAFLTMDLTWHGARAEAERFLARYARAANDFDLYPLVDFYESYRAFVRGKIAAFLMDNPALSLDQRERQRAQARRYFLLSLASERRPLLEPRLVCLGGVIASGKSTVAEAVSSAWAVPVVDADRTRKSLLDLEPLMRLPERPWSGAYSPEITRRTYDELLRRARCVIESGRAVVIDASFRSRALRARARELADHLGVPFLFVECRCPEELCRQRLEERRRQRGVSDGRAEIFDAFVAAWEPIDELATAEHIVLDTTRPVAVAIEQIANRWPRFAGPEESQREGSER